MEWTAPDGSLQAASFDDALDQARSSQRLRTALSLEGEWLPAVLRTAVSQLEVLRRDQPDAGGLVIAIDQDHARGIAAMLRDVVEEDRTFHALTIADPACIRSEPSTTVSKQSMTQATRCVNGNHIRATVDEPIRGFRHTRGCEPLCRSKTLEQYQGARPGRGNIDRCNGPISHLAPPMPSASDLS